MKKNKDYHNRLKVSLHGMNGRAYKMMVSFLELSCKGLVHVVIEKESQAEIIDIDLAHSKSLLEKRLAQQPSKPIIVLSVQEVLSDDVIYVKKPIEIASIVNAIKTVRKKVQKQNKRKKLLESLESSQAENKQKKVSSSLSKPVEKTKETLNNKSEEPTKIEVETIESVVTEPESLPETPTFESDLLQKSTVYIAEAERQYTELTVTTETIKQRPKPAMPTSVESYKVNALLDSFLNDDTFDFFGEENEIESLPNNNRKTVRYTIHSIKAKLAKASVIGFNKVFVVWVLNVSSKGALVKMETPTKLKGKVILTIYFDPKHIFSVPARIVRKESTSIYGLHFLSYQHKLADYLIENDLSFSIE